MARRKGERQIGSSREQAVCKPKSKGRRGETLSGASTQQGTRELADMANEKGSGALHRALDWKGGFWVAAGGAPPGAFSFCGGARVGEYSAFLGVGWGVVGGLPLTPSRGGGGGVVGEKGGGGPGLGGNSPPLF